MFLYKWYILDIKAVYAYAYFHQLFIRQGWEVIKYSSSVLKYNSEVLVLEYFHFRLLIASTPVSEGNIVLFNSLHLSDCCSYF